MWLRPHKPGKVGDAWVCIYIAICNKECRGIYGDKEGLHIYIYTYICTYIYMRYRERMGYVGEKGIRTGESREYIRYLGTYIYIYIHMYIK